MKERIESQIDEYTQEEFEESAEELAEIKYETQMQKVTEIFDKVEDCLHKGGEGKDAMIQNIIDDNERYSKMVHTRWQQV